MDDTMERYRQFVTYMTIGLFSAGVDYLIYSVLVDVVGIRYLVANIFSVHCGILSSFILNRQFNFKVKDYPLVRFVSFYLVGLLGLAISSGLLIALVEISQLDKSAAKIVAIVVVAVFQFILNKTITFRTT